MLGAIVRNRSLNQTKVRFKAGIIENCSQPWHGLPSEDRILSWVKGYEITLLKSHPILKSRGRLGPQRAPQEHTIGKLRTVKLSQYAERGVLETSSHEEGEFISNFFLRPKKQEGKIQVIR